MNKSKMRCIVSGEILGCRPEVYAKRVAKAGSEDELIRTYIGRNARNMLQEGKTVVEIRQEMNSPENLPEVPEDVLENIKVNTGKPKKKYSSKKQNPVAVSSKIIDPDIENFFNSGAEIDSTVLVTG